MSIKYTSRNIKYTSFRCQSHILPNNIKYTSYRCQSNILHIISNMFHTDVNQIYFKEYQIYIIPMSITYTYFQIISNILHTDVNQIYFI